MVNRKLRITAILFIAVLFLSLACLGPKWQTLDYDETFYRIKHAVTANPNFLHVSIERDVAKVPSRWRSTLNKLVGVLPIWKGKGPFRTMTTIPVIRIYEFNPTIESSDRLHKLVVSLNHDPYILAEHRVIQSP